MIFIRSTKKVAGLKIIDKPCPKCGRGMFLKPCPCMAKKRGWKVCAKCLKCGHIEGIQKRRKK